MNRPIVKVAVKYGLICGVLSVFAYYVQLVTGMNPVMNLNSFFIDLIIFFGFIFFANKEFKDYKNSGFLHFWQGMTIGLIIIFTSAVIFSVFSATYYHVNPEVLTEYIQNAVQFLEGKKELLLERESEAAYHQRLKDLKSTTISDVVITDFFKKVGVGFLVTPVIAVLLRKQSKN